MSWIEFKDEHPKDGRWYWVATATEVRPAKFDCHDDNFWIGVDEEVLAWHPLQTAPPYKRHIGNVPEVTGDNVCFP